MKSLATKTKSTISGTRKTGVKHTFHKHSLNAATRAQMRNILRPHGLQPKLTIGRQGDRYEQEADAVADRVVASMPVPEISSLAPGSLQSQPIEEEEELLQPRLQRQEEEEELLQRQSIEEEEELLQPLLQRQPLDEDMQMKSLQRQTEEEEEEEEEMQASGRLSRRPASTRAVNLATQKKYGGTSLNLSTRQALEHSMGIDFRHVRVHDDSLSHRAADEINAQAFTHKDDIWLGRDASQDDLHLMAHEAVHVVQQRKGNKARGLQRKETRADQADRLKEVSKAALSTAKTETKVSTAEPHWAKKLDTTNFGKLSKVLNYLKIAIIDLKAGSKKVDAAMVKLKDAITKITATKKEAKQLRAGGYGEFSAIAIFVKAITAVNDAKTLLDESKSKGIIGLDVWIKKIVALSKKFTETLSVFKTNRKVDIQKLEELRDEIKNLRSKVQMTANFNDFPIAAQKVQFVLRYFLSLNVSDFSNTPTLKEATDIRTKLGSADSDMVLIFGGKQEDFKLFSNFEDQLRHQILVRSEIKKKLGIDPGLHPTESNVENWFKSLKKSSNSDVINAYIHFASGYFIHRHETNPSVVAAKNTLHSLFARPTTISASRLTVCSGFAVLGKTLLEMSGAKFKKYFIGIRASDYQIKCSLSFDDVHAIAHIVRNDPTIKSGKLQNMYVSNDDIVFSKNDGIGPSAVAWTNKSNHLYEGTGSTLKGATKNAVSKIEAKRKTLRKISCNVK